MYFHDASVTTALFSDAIHVGIAFIATRENAKGRRDGLLYTRILAASYGGQLLEIMFRSTTNPNLAGRNSDLTAVTSPGRRESLRLINYFPCPRSAAPLSSN